MDIEVDDRDPLDTARLEHPDRHRDVVERAEAFAVVREGVMQPPRCDEIPNSDFRFLISSRPHEMAAAVIVPPAMTRKPSTISADHGSSSWARSAGTMCRRAAARGIRCVNERQVVPRCGLRLDEVAASMTPAWTRPSRVAGIWRWERRGARCRFRSAASRRPS
jgi:hypothetical protein